MEWLRNCDTPDMHGRFRFLNLILALVCAIPAYSQVRDQGSLEYAAGISSMIYQSVYSMEGAFAAEAAVRGTITDGWRWHVGGRFGTGLTGTELFGRLTALVAFEVWRPEAGLELGWTGRVRFKDGPMLLRESRKAMEGDAGPFYAAFHASPCSFMIGDGWRLSVLEFQLGTHVSHPGRTLRAQLGLFSLGVSP